MPRQLGHEVIGNQLAYFYMGALEAALQWLTGEGAAGGAPDLLEGSELSLQLKKQTAHQPLPKNALCSDMVCRWEQRRRGPRRALAWQAGLGCPCSLLRADLRCPPPPARTLPFASFRPPNATQRHPTPPNTTRPPRSSNFPQQCAYSYLPRAQGPDVGDWMRNDTGRATLTGQGWSSQTCSGQPVQQCDEEAIGEDFMTARR
jgi:hypothetical protein